MRTTVAVVLVALLAASGAFAIPDAYRSTVRPSVPTYRVPDDLAGVRHMHKVTNLMPAQREALASRGFVVIPDRAEQMFFLYEEYGDDYEKGPVPNFITVDSILQAYHSFFEFSLRDVEEKHLVKLCTALTQHFAGQTVADLQKCPAGPLRDAAAGNLAYFLVARRLLTGQEPSVGAPVPGKEGIIDMARAELGKIAAHAGRSALMGRTVHYDQFVPRGHYTRSEALSRYFQAMMWYGLLGFELDGPADEPARLQRHCLQALLMTRALYRNDWAQSLWERIYEPTDFFVGGSDDLGWREYLPVAQRVYGADLSLGKLADLDRLQQFIIQARTQLPAPRIAPAFQQADEAGNFEQVLHPRPQGRQFRLMGQRFIPDSWAMQQVVYPQVMAKPDSTMPRYWPMGLDVMAALGSARARDILFNTLNENDYKDYETQLDTVTTAFASKPESEWWQNLYWGWLHSLKPLFEPKGQGYPTFMQSNAWLDKELVTALGSWAQLRHDTILYGKQSGAEMGGDEPEAVHGYVEPYPNVYGRLAYLARNLRDGLGERGLLTERLSDSCSEFGSMLQFLKDCSEKQLRSIPLSRDDYNRIQWFGGSLERLTLSVASDDEYMRWYEITNEADRHIATIADVHTSFTECLEVGPGWAYRIYVIVPHPAGGLQVAKGGVMSYHEFRWPVSDRLTDEKWIEMLKSDSAPPMPDWTRSYVVH